MSGSCRNIYGGRETEMARIKEIKYHKKHRWEGILFAAPAILGFLIFTAGPMIASLIYSFTDYALVNDWKFIGADNYIELFSGEDPYFYQSLKVTIYYVALSVPLQLVVSFLFAMLLNQNVRFKSVFRTIFYMPTIVPAVAAAMVWMWVLDPDLGVLNNLLQTLHLPTSKWIYDEATVIPSLAMMSLWTVGGTMVIFLAGLQDIPQQLYEAAKIDGGNAWHRLFKITVPMMTPTIFFNLVMGIIGGLQTFNQAYIMTGGGPNNASLFYAFYLYRQAFSFSKMGSASAIAWVLFVLVLALTLIAFKSSDKWVYYEEG